VATQVERKIETEAPKNAQLRPERFLACISSNEHAAKNVIRKTARLAAYYNSKWWVLYVQTPSESGDRIGLAKQRHLINNFNLAQSLGAEVLKIQGDQVSQTILEQAEKFEVTTICIAKPRFRLFNIILKTAIFNQLLKKLSESDVDLVILS